MIRPGERKAPHATVQGAALCAIGCACAIACGEPSNDQTDQVPLCLDKAADATCTNVSYGLLQNGTIAPTFSEIFTRTLKPSCGSSSACHAGPNAQHGLRLDDETAAYDDLMAKNAAGTTARVIPNDTKCGELIVRLETPNEPWTMPKGSRLTDDLLCVFRHWIANGAPR